MPLPQPRPRISERGASAVEYALMASAVAAVIALSVYFFGENVLDLFRDSCEELVAQTQGDCDPP